MKTVSPSLPARLSTLVVTVVIALTVGPLTSASAAPVNDDFADAIEFSLTDPSPLTGTNVGATAEPDEPSHYSYTTTPTSVWWRFDAPGRGEVTLSTQGSTFDTVLAVYTGTSVTDLEMVHHHYWSDGLPQPFAVEVGTTYHVVVTGDDGATGDVTLGFSWEEGPPQGIIAVESPPGTTVDVLDLGTVPVGTSVARTISVHNIGNAPLLIEDVRLEVRSYAAGDYHVSADAATGAAIPAGDHRDVTVTFAPKTAPTGPPAVVEYDESFAGLPILVVDYLYFGGTLTGLAYYTYFHNTGGSGTVEFRAVAFNGATEADRTEGVTALVGGEGYAMKQIVAVQGTTISSTTLQVSLPTDFTFSHVMEPSGGTSTVPLLQSTGTSTFTRLADAMLVVASDDPSTPRTSVSFLGATQGAVGGEVERWWGADRYATAAAVSAAAFPGGADVAFVATGANFPDALAGGPAGGFLGGPILLTSRDDLPPATISELQRLGPDRIVILGGDAVVSPDVATQLAAHAPRVTRWAGPDRYATAAAVSANTFPAGAGTVFVATGANFPDALAGGPAGGLQGGPILLTAGDDLPPATITELQRLGPDRIVILGGDAVVSPDVATRLAAHAPHVTRWAGPDRYATAAAVSANTFPDGADIALVATGANFPDALAGGPAAGLHTGPILLTSRDSLTQTTISELQRLGVDRIIVLGGQAAISDAVATQLAAFVP